MLPLIVKDYNWSQTTDMIYIQVNIKGIRAAKASFLTADNYIRVYYPPYYFEVFLWGEVDERNAKCTLNENESQVVFELPKKLPSSHKLNETAEVKSKDEGESQDVKASTGDWKKEPSEDQIPMEWPQLEQTDLNKTNKNEIRVRAQEMSKKRAEEEIQAVLSKRHELRQMSIQEQIRLDEEDRKRIAALRTFEAESCLGDVDAWKEELSVLSKGLGNTLLKEQEKNQPNPRLSCDIEADVLQGKPFTNASDEGDSARSKKSDSSTCSVKSESPQSKHIWSSSELLKINKDKIQKMEAAKSGESILMPIRKGGTVVVKFTAREFPTPSRESTALMEEEWLAKQIEARRTCGFSDVNLKPEERNPTWLLEKGCELMKIGSYLGAASAFSTGLKLAPNLPELLVGRAQAQLALNNYIKAVEDASRAIELLTPKVNHNLKDRLDSHVCRGEAFRKLQMYQEAIGDYQEALRLDPDNKELQKDYAAVQQEN